MLGENKLVLSSQAMCQAIEYYLNNSILKRGVKVKLIEPHTTNNYSTYTITFIDRGEPSEEEIAAK